MEFSYHEEIVVAPRNFPFPFRKCATIDEHYAIIGTAFVVVDMHKCNIKGDSLTTYPMIKEQQIRYEN